MEMASIVVPEEYLKSRCRVAPQRRIGRLGLNVLVNQNWSRRKDRRIRHTTTKDKTNNDPGVKDEY